MRHAVVVVTFSLASFLAPLVSPVQAMPVIFTPAGTAAAGETFSLPVEITGAVDVWAWQFDLSFDPTVVRAVAVTEGPFLSSVGTSIFGPGLIDNSTGLVSLVTGAYVGLPSTPSGSGVLANIEFVALAAGAPAFHLSNVFLNLLPVGFEIANGSFAVIGDPPAPIPEPSTIVALMSGLLLIHARRRIHRFERG